MRFSHVILTLALFPMAAFADSPADLALPQHFAWRSPQICTGGRPENDAAFEAIKRQGVDVIVNVDGAAPDVEAAKRHGLRYIHLPMPYEVIPPEILSGMKRLLEEEHGKIYVHCHHGVHRAPAFAATALRMLGQETPEQARELLEKSGTSKNYPGLWYSAIEQPLGDVKACTTPLPERAEVGSLVEAMVHADDGYDLLKQYAANGAKPMPQHPDFVPLDAARAITQALEAVIRLPECNAPEFARLLRACVDSSKEFAAAVEKDTASVTPAAVTALQSSCDACHVKYRNPPRAAK